MYITDEINRPVFSIKIIGHQWYWEYEYNFKNLKNLIVNFENVESIIDKNLEVNSFRLLDVSENLILPIKCQLRLIILSDDVIHSFAIPSIGIKVDAVPGRLNQVSLLINRPGLFYGQCSEICGVNHRFIPIVIESVRFKNFIDFIVFGQKE